MRAELKWRKFASREGVDVTTIVEIDKIFYEMIRDYAHDNSELFFTYFQNKNFTHYSKVDSRLAGRQVYKKYLNSIAQIKKYYFDGLKFLKFDNQKAKIWKKNIARRGGSKDLLLALNDFKKEFAVVNRIYSIISFYGIEAWQTDFEEALSAMIARNNLESQKPKIVNSINKPWKKTALIHAQEELEQGKNSKVLAQKYQFLRSWSIVWYRPLTEQWIKEIGSSVAADKKEKLYTRAQLFKLLKPTKEELVFLDVAPYIVFFKDWRDDLRRMFSYRWVFLFEAIANFFRIHYNDLGFFTLDEMERFLQAGKINMKILEQRKNAPMVVTAALGQKIRMRVVSSNGLAKYEVIMRQRSSSIQKQELRGLVAQKGMARGTVKIVHNYHDVKNVLVGDILVANTTHPNYLPAMQRAAAFVTNEGGLICHAAIVARELKKPCIVGTKIATQVFKDGDVVEVDAEKGIVRKI